MKLLTWLSMAGLVILLGATAGHGQSTQGSIVGTVRDQTNAFVGDVGVTIKNERTGESRVVVNAVAALRTELAPLELLDALLDLEAGQGRVRSVPNAARTLDLDLLLFDDRVISEPRLEVPHPRMHERRFVLLPLAELNPDLIIPGHGPVADLLPRVAGQDVTRIDAE